MTTPGLDVYDTATTRKSRGAYFTPPDIARFMTSWAIRDATDRVLEPSCGDAEFLVQATEVLKDAGVDRPAVYGVELHEQSAHLGSQRIAEVGGESHIEVGDFFTYESDPRFDAVIGNPPYIRFQQFSGASRALAQAASLRGGVRLSGLASAWAAFTVHASMQLREGGRLAFVLPAELLTANYAGPVRRFLFDHFRHVELILFEQRAFAEAETETVLMLADGYSRGPAENAQIRQVRSAKELATLPPAVEWTPEDPSDKWSWSALTGETFDEYRTLLATEDFVELGEWGHTRLGAVTGNNKFFTLTSERVAELGLPRRELLRLSPPGSAHLRGLELSTRALNSMGKDGKRAWLFRPSRKPSDAAQAYIDAGETAGVHDAYKCRVRSPWWRVPILEPADFLLTYMNADTPRIVTNRAGAYHLNSVHGVYLQPEHRDLGRAMLPLASLNSMTLLGAETVGRAYGGGMLKMEPGEAGKWPMPSPSLVESMRDELEAVRPQVAGRLRQGRLLEAVKLIDRIVLVEGAGLSFDRIKTLREARATLATRRETRGRGVQD